MAINLALMGIGKIARDQHLPAIADSDAFELIATVSRSGGIAGVPNFETIDALVAADTGVQAISLCTPPRGRHAIAATALQAGLDVMLEKPPSVTLGEGEAMAALATAHDRTLYASWHSRAAAGVAPARNWLADREIQSIRIDWLENIREWHPGQEWILEAGGFGVFDPGINALSILTALLPDPVLIDRATLEVPGNRAAPIAAALHGRVGEALFDAQFDFLKQGAQRWTIVIETDAGRLELVDGGARALVDGNALQDGAAAEYPALYAHFAELVRNRRSDVDLSPLRIVADAMLCAETVTRERFEF